MLEAVRCLARTEGLLLDPVYSGKAFAGLLCDIKNGFYHPGDKRPVCHDRWHAGLVRVSGGVSCVIDEMNSPGAGGGSAGTLDFFITGGFGHNARANLTHITRTWH